MTSLLRLLLTLAGAIGTLYLLVCVLLYFRQTRMIFFPSAVVETTPAELGMAYEDVWLPVQNGDQAEKIHGWWIPAQGIEQGVVLHLHGNGVNIGANVGQAYRFYQLNLSVLLIDYRGYGRNQGGFPNEAQVYEDVQTAWDYLTQERQISPGRIFIYGHSLGGAIGIDLALRQPDAAGLIVQCSFTSIREMVHRTTPFGIFPVDLLLTQKFDSIAKVPSLQVPVLFVHGKDDRQTPAVMTKELYAAAPEPKQLYLVPGAGHNDVGDVAGAEYMNVLQQFFQTFGRANPSTSIGS